MGTWTLARPPAAADDRDATPGEVEMRAAVVTAYGPPEVIEVRDVETPVPGTGELLVRVRATTVVAGDVRIRSSTYTRFGRLVRLWLGWRRPRRTIPGDEFSGVVEAVGAGVRRFAVGDEVFGMLGGIAFAGANAEFVCVPEDGMVAAKPDTLSHEQAAAIPVGGLTAWHFLRRSGLREGQRILVIGASGSVGTYAVQLASHLGAHVTAVCSTSHLDLVRSIGAERVIDYTTDDVASSGETHAVVFDAAMVSSLREARHLIAPGGVFVSLDWPLVDLLRALLDREVRMVVGMAPERPEDLLHLRGLAEQGVIRPVIDRTYPLERIVDAHRHAEHGHKQGNLVVTVGA